MRGSTLCVWALMVLSLGALAAGTTEAQTSCFAYQQSLVDTSDNGNASPFVDRPIGAETIQWNGGEFLISNLGNDLRAWRMTAPTSASLVASSDWHPNPVPSDGDVDQNMFGFSVCDDCRYGFAAYRNMGSVVFDMGTGSTPGFGSMTYYSNANTLGGVVFKVGAEEYLIAPDLDSGLGTKLYRMQGTDLSNLTALADVRLPSGANVSVRKGEAYGRYVYIATSSGVRQVVIVDAGTPSSPVTVGFTPCANAAFPLSVDQANGYLAVAKGGTSPGIEIYDISGDPMGPSLVGQINTPAGIHSVTIQYPYLFASSNTTNYQNVWDISVPSSPALIDDDFWNNTSYTWNGGDGTVGGITTYQAAFHSSGEGLYVARFTQLQVHSVACTAVQPTANLSLAPSPVFPGDTVTVTNTSTGPWTRSAIWITDEQGAVVAGSETLSASTPGTLDFTIPVDLLQSQSYTAHVAVENDDYPFYPQNPGQQLKDVAITVDRAPEASIAISPQAVITGDTVTLTAVAEGTPGVPIDGDPFDWTLTPPTGGSCPTGWVPQDSMTCTAQGRTPPGVLLDVSGTWAMDLTVYYQHEAAAGGLYQVVTGGQVEVSSVAADFSISPASPLTTQAITLDGSASRWQAGADVSFDWRITGPSSYTGCGDVQTCVIPAETLQPGTYTIVLTLTNTGNGDESVHEDIVEVADGSVQLDFSWTPSSPEIGQVVMFEISGVNGSIDQAQWNFGGPGCSGYDQVTTCTPTFTDCTSQAYKYASGGPKTVSLTVTVNGQQYGPVSHSSLTVQSSGSCSGGGSCSYTVSPTSASFNSAGGTGSISVSTSTGCSWSATSNSSWIHITSGTSGSGNGTVRYSVDANTSGSSRNGNLTVAGRTVSISQSSGSSTLDFSWSPGSPQIGDTVVFSLQGLSGSVTRAVWDFGDAGCSGYSQQMTCVPDSFNDCTQQAFKFSSGGDKTVTVAVTVNGSQQSPVSHTVTVANTGSCGSGGCSYSISPLSATIGGEGGSGTVSVTTSSGCDWTATSNVSWIHVTSGASGTGSGTVAYSVDANGSADARQGTMTVAGRTFTVNQAGGGGGGGTETGPMLVPAAASIPGLGGTYWKSDLRIFNPSDQQVEIQIQYLPEPGDTTPYPTLLYNVNPDQTIWIDDVMYWFTQGAAAKGALVITYDPEDGPRPLVASRTYNQTDAGTYGQFIPVLGSSSLAGAGGRLIVPGVEHSDLYRTNVGLVNSGTEGAGVTVTLIDESGNPVVRAPLGVPAGNYMQLSLDAIAAQDPDAGDVSGFKGTVVVDVSNGGPVAAYGSVVDQQTGDPIFIEAIRQ